MKTTWEHIFKYATTPVGNTAIRKLRNGVSLTINKDEIRDGALVYLGDSFIKVTRPGTGKNSLNSYYDLEKITTFQLSSPGGH